MPFSKIVSGLATSVPAAIAGSGPIKAKLTLIRPTICFMCKCPPGLIGLLYKQLYNGATTQREPRHRLGTSLRQSDFAQEDGAHAKKNKKPRHSDVKE